MKISKSNVATVENHLGNQRLPNLFLLSVLSARVKNTVQIYYLAIWDTQAPKEKPKIKEIKRFYNAIEAWKFVLDNNIKSYSVDAGECVIDNS